MKISFPFLMLAISGVLIAFTPIPAKYGFLPLFFFCMGYLIGINQKSKEKENDTDG